MNPLVKVTFQIVVLYINDDIINMINLIINMLNAGLRKHESMNQSSAEMKSKWSNPFHLAI